MKALAIFTFFVMSSTNVFSQTKAVRAIVPAHVNKVPAKTTPAEAPCADSKEDVLKKLEEKKKAQAQEGKGFSLQGSKDTGCSIK
jgi:hypothetical protein